MGTLLVFAGYGVMFVGGIMVLIAAFKESILWGLGCIFVPLVSLIFVIMHWQEAKSGFFLQLAGVPCVIIGVVLAGGDRAELELKEPAPIVLRVERNLRPTL